MGSYNLEFFKNLVPWVHHPSHVDLVKRWGKGRIKNYFNIRWFYIQDMHLNHEKNIHPVLLGNLRKHLAGNVLQSCSMQYYPSSCCNCSKWTVIFSAPIVQGYGLTESCAGGTFSEYDDTSVGRVGAPLPCSFIKVSGWKYFTCMCFNARSWTYMCTS